MTILRRDYSVMLQRHRLQRQIRVAFDCHDWSPSIASYNCLRSNTQRNRLQ